MGVTLQVRAVVENRGLELEFGVAAGEVLAVLGPNGAGKSTTLHSIAGLVGLDAGRIQVGDRVLSDTATGVQVPTHARRVGLLLQDSLLFPHLSVAANVAFGSRSGCRLGRRAAYETARHWLAEVDATDLATRRPRQLSGGQAQRVALARALAADPEVLLLDEPLAGLDVAVAASMRKVLRRVLTRGGRCAVLITHDLLDVLTLADRVIVVEAGRIVESGSAAEVLATPKSHFAARFAGVNLISGTAATDGVLTTRWDANWHGTPAADVRPGAPVVAVFSPSSVSVYRDEPHGSPRNTVAVTVAELDSRGPGIRVRADEQPDGAPGLAADITAESAAELRLAPGDAVYFSVKAQEVVVHLAGIRE
ncbi:MULTISPECIES: sulfate/molybdate ABC transporter ATP-binding protein [unclassified Mycolicibacterium]|uniref:sulfate/molybdate ABC transporter ATP-binding protein n=1 Tax=unclassified Mycolicibacterium TaxID=2636767 RepID=UPI0012DD4984|nr:MULTISPECIES: ATP-binding cassette domain-containing protein [unclassified Mycolicibacterium]MUL85472.1 ATP-binding cassette domain-containing protein [Mycolicibacterium sp. CBMA 329]MUL88764.1 ATP-binding cassette domain-containing protein [Mycolicibacterium sp. CBMA 331]MUM01942.1 ATP-binding cassette domain-containing protein [Mycolicibacterium sp. CBMA 334]MUM24855.1 ATP-binding cassette domain-containing protein [Mycolicibacterium sp. CBMA 295]MUM40411.1 ATP-binding cassette domain-con